MFGFGISFYVWTQISNSTFASPFDSNDNTEKLVMRTTILFSRHERVLLQHMVCYGPILDIQYLTHIHMNLERLNPC